MCKCTLLSGDDYGIFKKQNQDAKLVIYFWYSVNNGDIFKERQEFKFAAKIVLQIFQKLPIIHILTLVIITYAFLN